MSNIYLSTSNRKFSFFLKFGKLLQHVGKSNLIYLQIIENKCHPVRYCHHFVFIFIIVAVCMIALVFHIKFFLWNHHHHPFWLNIYILDLNSDVIYMTVKFWLNITNAIVYKLIFSVSKSSSKRCYLHQIKIFDWSLKVGYSLYISEKNTKYEIENTWQGKLYWPILFGITARCVKPNQWKMMLHYFYAFNVSCNSHQSSLIVGYIKKPHNRSHASDPMSWIFNDMMNKGYDPFRQIRLLVANKEICT